MIQKQIKDLAWNTFKQTGNINTFMELMQVQNMQNSGIYEQAKDIQGMKNKKD